MQPYKSYKKKWKKWQCLPLALFQRVYKAATVQYNLLWSCGSVVQGTEIVMLVSRQEGTPDWETLPRTAKLKKISNQSLKDWWAELSSQTEVIFPWLQSYRLSQDWTKGPSVRIFLIALWSMYETNGNQSNIYELSITKGNFCSQKLS